MRSVPVGMTAAVALIAGLGLGLGGCKQKLPTQDWARTILVTRSQSLSELEFPVVKALDEYDAQTAAQPAAAQANREALSRKVEALLEAQSWISGYGPVTLTTGEGSAKQTTRLPIAPNVKLATVEGGSEHLPGVAVPPRQQLYWGLYKTRDDTYGGIEIQSMLRNAHSTLTLHLYVLPGVPQQRLR